MEEEVCHYDKFGFCKYRKDCRKRHFSEVTRKVLSLEEEIMKIKKNTTKN